MNSSLYVWYNFALDLLGPGDFFFGSFNITDSISLMVTNYLLHSERFVVVCGVFCLLFLFFLFEEVAHLVQTVKFMCLELFVVISCYHSMSAVTACSIPYVGNFVSSLPFPQSCRYCEASSLIFQQQRHWST